MKEIKGDNSLVMNEIFIQKCTKFQPKTMILQNSPNCAVQNSALILLFSW